MTSDRTRYQRPANDAKPSRPMIKQGFRRFTGVYDHESAVKAAKLTLSPRMPMYSVQQDSLIPHGSFETYLRALPKLDPIDRTVGWVFHQSEGTGEVRRISFSKLPPRESIRPNLSPSEHVPPDTSCLDTSLSRYESERGTQGRGTPPSYNVTRPRLDELWRQQERGGAPDLEAVGGAFLPVIAARRAVAVPTAANRGASRRNRAVPACWCEWAGCGAPFASSREMYSHVERCHITRAPLKMADLRTRGVSDHLCQWRTCPEGTKAFAARYKLLLHVQRVHCTERVERTQQPVGNMVWGKTVKVVNGVMGLTELIISVEWFNVPIIVLS